MGRRAGHSTRFRNISAPLLTLLLVLCSTPAAALTPFEKAYFQARELVDRSEFAAAAPIVDDALRQHGTLDQDAIRGLRILRGWLDAIDGKWDAAERAFAADLPAHLRGSELESRLLLYRMFMVRTSPVKFAAAADRARLQIGRHQPAMMPMWHTLMSAFGPHAEQEAHGRTALRMAQAAGNHAIELRAYVDLIRRWVDQQRWSEVAREGERALKKSRNLRYDALGQKIQGNLGWLYLTLGDVDTAAQYFTEAAATAARAKLRSDHATWIAQTGEIHLQRGEYDAAADAFGQAYELAMALKKSDLIASMPTALARVELARGRLREAAQHARQAGDGEPARMVLAAIETAAGRHDEALTLLQKLTRSTAQPVKWEAEGRLAQLYARMKRTGDAERHFLEAIKTARTARSKIAEKELRFAFFHVIDEIFDSYVDFLVETNRAATALVATETLRAQTLLEGRPPAARLDLIALARQRNAAILSYWLGDEHSYMWLVTPREVKIRRLPPAKELDVLVERYQRLTVGSGSLASMAVPGRRLYELLVAPAGGDLVRGERVIVIPDGRLHELNFETLVVPGPKPRFFIEDAVVMTAGSLQLLARAPRVRARPRSMLVIGDPPRAEERYPALPHAKEEIRRVAARFEQPAVFAETRATPSAYRDAEPAAYEFIHFVAHAEAAQQKPLDSAVILAREPSGGYRLEARKIAESQLAARLVTVSSCHGAGKRAYVGEGLVGLAWAFLRAGAQQVVAALWKVDDAATPGLMDEMYAGIRAGRDPAEALRDAKLRLVRSNTVHRRPYYWAPFVLYAGG